MSALTHACHSANKTIRYPYHQTMAHQPMDPNNWIEIDRFYRSDLEVKRKVLDTQGKAVCDVLPESAAACTELMEHISFWLAQRYPRLFSITGEEIQNHIMGETLSLSSPAGVRKAGIEALTVVSRLVQDDYLIAHPREDGTWYCTGGLVCFPGFYLLSQKIGMNMEAIHEHVPRFNENLLKSVERSFTRMLPSQPIERTSWEFTVASDPTWLFWCGRGPLPTSPGVNGVRAVPMAPAHLTGRGSDWSPDLVPEVQLRLEHQTLVKMPKSGVIFFGVHAMRRPLKALADLPLLPKLILQVHGDERAADLLRYKGLSHYKEPVNGYLKKLHQNQIDQGLIQGNEDVRQFRELKEALDRANE